VVVHSKGEGFDARERFVKSLVFAMFPKSAHLVTTWKHVALFESAPML
jgi:hypothetical protein